MPFIRTSDKKYPLTEKDIRIEFPNIVFPKIFKCVGYECVFSTPKPIVTGCQYIMEDIPILTNKGTWEQSWKIIDKFKDIEDGLSQLEQETAFLENELIKKKQQKQQNLAKYRYDIETAGVIINGSKIRTDENSQAKISGMFNACQINPDILIDFKTVNGWVKIDSEAVTSLAKIVSEHVQKCYSRERELSEAIEIDVDTDITDGWPEY